MTSRKYICKFHNNKIRRYFCIYLIYSAIKNVFVRFLDVCDVKFLLFSTAISQKLVLSWFKLSVKKSLGIDIAFCYLGVFFEVANEFNQANISTTS